MKNFVMVSVLLFTVITFSFAGGIPERSSMDSGQIAKEKVMQTAVGSVHVPRLVNFLERKNVAKRAKIFDNPEQIGYLYLLADNGAFIGYYTILGKVSSLRSYMVPQEVMDHYNGYPYVLQDADIDGTYGENVAGIFFFTTDNVYVEYTGKHLMSTQPISINVPLLNVKVK